MSDDVSGMAAVLEAALAKALHANETTGGWWEHPECAEFARIVTPQAAAALAEAGYGHVGQAKAEALEQVGDEAWIRATEATSEDSSWRGVTRWLRDRAEALRAGAR